MSNKVPKAKAKALKKEKAVKKARLKAFIVVLIVVLILAAVVVTIGIVRGKNNSNAQHSAETYALGRQTVQLLENGTFSASLAHGVQKSGTYTKTTEGNRTIVSFNVNGKTEIGRIENNSLHLPSEWEDGHGHGNVFPKVNETP